MEMEIETVFKLVKCLQESGGESSESPKMLSIGKKLFIRTVTHYYTGQIKSFSGQFLELEDAAWIADTGRFHEFLKDGSCNEYEGFPDSILIPIGAIVDITPWGHKLFKGNK